MDTQKNTGEQSGDNLGRFTRKFGDKVIRKVLAGHGEIVLNPRLNGLGAYRDEAVYPYIQNSLQKEGITTEIVSDLIESGSEKQIPRDTLVVKYLPDTTSEA